MIRVGMGACARRSLLAPGRPDKALRSIYERFLNAICFHGGRAGGEEATECIAESLWQLTCMLSKSVFNGPERGRHVRLVVLHHPPISGRLPDLENCEQKVMSMQGCPSSARARESQMGRERVDCSPLRTLSLPAFDSRALWSLGQILIVLPLPPTCLHVPFLGRGNL